jgi:hypothetical protein
LSPRNAIALRTAAERGRLLIVLPKVRELPWLAKTAVPRGATLFTDPERSFIAGNAQGASSDTGELRRDWEQGIFTVSTRRTQAAMGRIGGRTVKLPDVEVSLSTPDATVAVQSLDGNPIRRSDDIMISAGARSGPEPGSRYPIFSEPVEGKLTIYARKGLRLYRWASGLRTRVRVTTPYARGRYTIALDKSLRSYWLILGRARAGRPEVAASGLR